MRSTGVLYLLANGILLSTAARFGILEALLRVASLFSLSLGVLADMALCRVTTGCRQK